MESDLNAGNFRLAPAGIDQSTLRVLVARTVSAE